MSGPRVLKPDEADELLDAIEKGPGTPVPNAWARWMRAYEEHKAVAPPDCECIQCAVDRGEIEV